VNAVLLRTVLLAAALAACGPRRPDAQAPHTPAPIPDAAVEPAGPAPRS